MKFPAVATRTGTTQLPDACTTTTRGTSDDSGSTVAAAKLQPNRTTRLKNDPFKRRQQTVPRRGRTRLWLSVYAAHPPTADEPACPVDDVSPVDSATGVDHPIRVLTLSRRIIALTLTALVAAGNPAICAGWAATPEARMACCNDGQPCSMHKGRSEGSATQSVTQAQADSCCALSEQEQSGQSNQAFAAPVSSAVLGPGIVVPPAQPRLVVTDAWRTGTPVPSPPVSKHVLISVFLL
jgi:hypothetical protein